MKIEQFEKAKELLCELDKTRDIKNAMQKEPRHWWAIKTPDTKRNNDGDGMYIPKVLREEFEKAVESAIQKLTKEIESI